MLGGAAQSIEDAIKQYRTDRDPRNVTLARRAVVHFAVDPDLVAMTTKLAGALTQFLPFNRGSEEGGAGNPFNPRGHKTAYLWDEVWQRDAWLLTKEVIPAWGTWKAQDIRRRDVIALLDHLVERGAPIQANRVLSLVRKLFNWAVSREILEAKLAEVGLV